MRTEQELKEGLAKLLPDLIYVSEPSNRLCWKVSSDETLSRRFLDERDWLHVCWLIEQKMTEEQYTKFEVELELMFFDNMLSASWQQRAEAILNL